jgi:hypothetical protein
VGQATNFVACQVKLVCTRRNTYERHNLPNYMWTNLEVGSRNICIFKKDIRCVMKCGNYCSCVVQYMELCIFVCLIVCVVSTAFLPLIGYYYCSSGVRLCLNGTAAANGPIVRPPDDT